MTKVVFDDAPRSWTAVRVTTTQATIEAIEYALMEAGARGTETRTPGAPRMIGGDVAEVIGYFDEPPAVDFVRGEIESALRIFDCEADAVTGFDTSEEPARDWLAEWKANWQPTLVADTFVVAAPWNDVSAHRGLHVIRIEPGMAFGTGTHETTRLCLAALAGFDRGTKSVLDVGTGTGVLAIAAALAFPHARIEACDTDADSVRIAIENARLNSVADRIAFRAGSIDDETASADVVLANLTADVILPLLPALVGLTCGRLVLSGVLATQADAVRARLAELGAHETAMHADGEWVAFIV